MTERDPEEYEALEFLDGVEEAMDSEAPLDELGPDERFPVEDDEYVHGGLEESRLSWWAWSAVALVPVLVFAAGLLARAARGTFAEAAVVASVGASALALTAPTAAIVLGYLAVRRSEPRARAAVVVGVLCLVTVACLVSLVMRSPVVLAMSAFAYALAMFTVIAFVQAVARRS